MIRNHSRTEKRSAFTIVELMVVVLIIVALAGMLFAGVMKVMGKIPETQTRTEIGQLDTAIASFMADYNLSDPPPSSLLIQENGALYTAANAGTTTFLTQMFGRSFNWAGAYDWNGNGILGETYILSGQQLLVFYLGGIPTYSAPGVVSGMSGFSPNVANPALPAAASSRRKGPYFNFVPSRLVYTGFFPVYNDPWQVKNAPTGGISHPNGTPYAFFSTQGKVNGYSASDCALVAYPYYETSNVVTGVFTSYTYNNRYQIISAGKDGIFGGGVNPATGLTTTPAPGVGVPWISSSGATLYGADDQANFSSGLLGTGQH